MSGEQELYDAGLQPERTALSWRRTALSLAVGALVSIRLLPELLGGPVWAVPGFAGLVAAGALWITGERRYREFFRHRIPQPHTPFGAWPLLLTAAGTLVLGLGAVSVLVHTRI